MPLEGEVRGNDNDDLDAVLVLLVRGFLDREIEVEFVIDTGFTGAISLTTEQVAFLNLPPAPDAVTFLADGTITVVPTYNAIVVWESGVQRIVNVVGQDATPLIGMGLLAGYNLSIDIAEGGVARITPL